MVDWSRTVAEDYLMRHCLGGNVAVILSERDSAQWEGNFNISIDPLGQVLTTWSSLNWQDCVAVLTFSLLRIEPRPRMAIFVCVCSWSHFRELPFGPRSLPTKLYFKRKKEFLINKDELSFCFWKGLEVLLVKNYVRMISDGHDYFHL